MSNTLKPYSLLLLSHSKVDSLSKSVSSNQMIGFMLDSEFKKLAHVDVTYKTTTKCQIDDLPTADFVLIHTYLGDPIFKRINDLKKKARLKFSWTQSIPHSQADISFVWVPWPRSGCVCHVIPLPCAKSILKERTVKKEPKTILLDHGWPSAKGTENEWTERMIIWLSELKDDYEVYKLLGSSERSTDYPDWLNGIKVSTYLDYLERTKYMESFVITHRGSYNHSIVDMAGRGMRIISPENFTHRDTVGLLDISVVKNRSEFLTEIRKPIRAERVNRQIDRMTDMRDVVKKMDAVFMGEMK